MEEKIEIRKVSEREIWVEENKLYLDEDNILCIIAVGFADEKTMIAIKENSQKLVAKVEGKGDVLVDLNKAEKPSPEARKIWKELNENEEAGKVAVFGLHPVARVLASFTMGVSKKKDMRFFKTKEDAIKWLKE